MPSFISIFAASTLSALVAAVPAPTGTEAGLPFWGKGNLEIIRDYKRIGCLGELGNVAFGNERCGVFFGDWQADGSWNTATSIHPYQGCQFSYGTDDFPNRFACTEGFPSADFTTDGGFFLMNPKSNTTSFWLYNNGDPHVRILESPYNTPPTKKVRIYWKSTNGTTS